MDDNEYIPEKRMGFQRIDPKDVEVGMRVQVLYRSTTAGQVVREGPVTDVEIKETDSSPILRIKVRHAEHRATIVGGRISESDGSIRGTYGVSSESAVRTTSVGELLAMYFDSESI